MGNSNLSLQLFIASKLRWMDPKKALLTFLSLMEMKNPFKFSNSSTFTAGVTRQTQPGSQPIDTDTVVEAKCHFDRNGYCREHNLFGTVRWVSAIGVGRGRKTKTKVKKFLCSAVTGNSLLPRPYIPNWLNPERWQMYL